MADKKKGYDPRSKNELPGGAYKQVYPLLGITKQGAYKPDTTIGDKAGSATSRVGEMGKGERLIRKIGMNDDRDDTRAYTPQEAQKRQAAGDQDAMRKQADDAKGGKIPSYKKGGLIKKTGPANLHKGERVIPKAKVAKVDKLMKKRG